MINSQEARQIIDAFLKVSNRDTYNLGDNFFKVMIKLLAETLEANHVFVGKLTNDMAIETVSMFSNGKYMGGFRYELAFTPCESVIDKTACTYTNNVADLFPNDTMLKEMGINGYSGVPLFDSKQNVSGILVALFEYPIANKNLVESLLLFVASRCSAELEHLEIKRNLEASNSSLLKANEELTLAKNLAEESDRLKTVFLANMSHELRTPMNAINGFSELIEDEHSPEKLKNYARIIRANSMALLSFMDNIFDLSKLTTNQLKIFTAKTNISRIINEIYTYTLKLYNPQNINYTTSIDLPENMMVTTDSERVNKILLLLIDNAFKFTTAGKISLIANTKEDVLTIAVADTGLGINPDERDSIFEPFMQGSNHQNKFAGCGMGLTIARGLANKLGGTIAFEEIPDYSTVISLKLPINHW